MAKKISLESGYCCPYDKSPCKKYDHSLGAGACFIYDVNSRVRFVCKRYAVVMAESKAEDRAEDSMTDDERLADFLG